MNRELIYQIIVFFLLAGVGYAVRRFNLLDEHAQKTLSGVIINIALPASILASSQQPAEPQNTGIIAVVLAGAAVYYAAAIALSAGLARMLKLAEKRRAVFIMLTVFANTAFIGYPVVTIFLPEQGVFFASFFSLAYNVLFFTYGMSRFSGRGISAKAIFGNGVVLAVLVMAGCYLLQIKFPAPIAATLNMLGSLSTPLSMLATGMMLSGIKFNELFNVPELYITTGLRLLVIPTVVFLVLRALGIGGAAGTVLLIMSCLPCGSMVAIAAAGEDCEPQMAAKGVLLSTLLFLGAMPYIAFLQHRL